MIRSPTMTTSTRNLSDVLSRLMFHKRIRVMELSRQTGVPQTTLQRIVKGTIEKPRQVSLQPIADYFKVSLEQLKGLKPIAWLSAAPLEETGWMPVPLLSWEKAAASTEHEMEEGLLYTEAKVAKNGAFALTMNDSSMEPLFPEGTVLVIDRHKTPKDRSYVVTLLKDHPQPIFRQLLVDGPNRYLKTISPDFDRSAMNLMSKDDKIVGVLAQARRNY